VAVIFNSKIGTRAAITMDNATPGMFKFIPKHQVEGTSPIGDALRAVGKGTVAVLDGPVSWAGSAVSWAGDKTGFDSLKSVGDAVAEHGSPLGLIKDVVTESKSLIRNVGNGSDAEETSNPYNKDGTLNVKDDRMKALAVGSIMSLDELFNDGQWGFITGIEGSFAEDIKGGETITTAPTPQLGTISMTGFCFGNGGCDVNPGNKSGIKDNDRSGLEAVMYYYWFNRASFNKTEKPNFIQVQLGGSFFRRCYVSGFNFRLAIPQHNVWSWAVLMAAETNFNVQPLPHVSAKASKMSAGRVASLV